MKTEFSLGGFPTYHPVFPTRHPCFQAITACFQAHHRVSKLFLFPNSYVCFELNFISKLIITLSASKNSGIVLKKLFGNRSDRLGSELRGKCISTKFTQNLAWFLFQSITAALTASIIALHYSEACDLVSIRFL